MKIEQGSSPLLAVQPQKCMDYFRRIASGDSSRDDLDFLRQRLLTP